MNSRILLRTKPPLVVSLVALVDGQNPFIFPELMRNGHAHIIFITFKQVCQADQNPQSLAEAKGLHVFMLRG